MSKVECDFITCILEGTLSLELIKKHKFEARWMSFIPEVYEFIDDYYSINQKLPSIELTETRFVLYQKTEVVDNPEDIVIALKKASELKRFHDDIRQTIKLLETTVDVKRARDFLENKLDKYTEDEDDVFEITSPEFTIGQEDYKKRRENFLNSGSYGIPTGLGKEFDTYINGGFQNGNLYYFIGLSKIGKSWVMQVLAREAVLSGKVVLACMLEGLIEKEYKRFMSLMTGISNVGLYRGNLEESEVDKAEDDLRKMAKDFGGKAYIATWGKREHYTVATLRNKVKLIKPDLVIVDYLTMLNNDDKEMNWNDYLQISKGIKVLAQSYNVPVVCVVQSDMAAMSQDELNMTNIAMSKGIIRDADAAFGITKVKGEDHVIKINDVAGRDMEETDVSFLYQTGWNTGRIKYLGKNDGSNRVI